MNKTTKILLIVAIVVVIAAAAYGIHHMLNPTDMPM
ncbi:flagellar basal body-associated protein FliL [Anaerosolibacter carboniphilus]|uniref:Flagellar basal body-associated protein FliL n=1 Tax=Anaerosolibacter carboniphilus TaxID=1417629 RepID=A0A841KQ70_9FIRM|nr:flagellar basal body-associated protein FliL [Anaerosolibacter carboniphilus]